VGYSGDEVVVFKGRPGGVLWFQPTVEARTSLTREDLPTDLADEISGEPTFSEARAAQKYVNGIRDEVQPIPITTLPAITTTTVAPAPSSSVPSSTTLFVTRSTVKT
jgi:hypothetical protein